MHISTSSLNYDPNKYTAHIISSNTVLTRNIFIDAWVMFRMIFGGRIGLYVDLVKNAREEVLNNIETQASDLGSELVVGLNIETNSIHPGTIEVLAYATALVKK